MSKSRKENEIMIEHLLKEGYHYVVREENGALVACNVAPMKFPEKSEWGAPQTVTQNAKALPVDEGYFEQVVRYADTKPVPLDTLKTAYIADFNELEQAYELALRIQGKDVPSATKKPAVPKSMQALKQFYDSGMRYLVRQEDEDLALFEYEPVKDDETGLWISSNPMAFRVLFGNNTDEAFDDIAYEDVEPTPIEDLLNDYDLLDE